MAKKEPFIITEHDDGTVTLTIAGINKKFGNKKALFKFAENLHDQASSRWTGPFKLQDTDNGGVDIIFRNGDTIHTKGLEVIVKLALCIAEKTEEK